jgi:hypothetical protein
MFSKIYFSLPARLFPPTQRLATDKRRKKQSLAGKRRRRICSNLIKYMQNFSIRISYAEFKLSYLFLTIFQPFFRKIKYAANLKKNQKSSHNIFTIKINKVNGKEIIFDHAIDALY